MIDLKTVKKRYLVPYDGLFKVALYHVDRDAKENLAWVYEGFDPTEFISPEELKERGFGRLPILKQKWGLLAKIPLTPGEVKKILGKTRMDEVDWRPPETIPEDYYAL